MLIGQWYNSTPMIVENMTLVIFQCIIKHELNIELTSFGVIT